MWEAFFSSGALTPHLWTEEINRTYSYHLDQAGALKVLLSLYQMKEGWAPFCGSQPGCGKPPGKMRSPREDPHQAGLRAAALRGSVLEPVSVLTAAHSPEVVDRGCHFWALVQSFRDAHSVLATTHPPPKLQGSSTITCNTNPSGDLLKMATPIPLPFMDPDSALRKTIQWERSSDGEGLNELKDRGTVFLQTPIRE